MNVVSSNPVGLTVARYVKALAIAKGDPMGAEAFAQARNWHSTPGVLTAIKAAQDPLDRDAANTATRELYLDFAALLRPLTIVGRLQGLRRVPFQTRMLGATSGITGAWVREGRPIPVGAMELDGGGVQLEALKVAAISVLTMELARRSDPAAESVIAADVGAGIAAALDVSFIDPASGGTADEEPAAITSGATAFSSSGSDVASIDADLKLMLAVLTDAEMPLTTASWIMSPTTATHLSLLRGSSGAPAFPGMTARGGTLLGLPVVTSKHVTASGSPGERFIALVEASEIEIADDGESDISISQSASVQMDSAPPTGAQQLVNLWQLGLVAVRGIRMVNWKRRRDGAVAVLRDVTY